jgi:hypothetical protein
VPRAVDLHDDPLPSIQEVDRPDEGGVAERHLSFGHRQVEHLDELDEERLAVGLRGLVPRPEPLQQHADQCSARATAAADSGEHGDLVDHGQSPTPECVVEHAGDPPLVRLIPPGLAPQVGIRIAGQIEARPPPGWWSEKPATRVRCAAGSRVVSRRRPSAAG